MRILRHLSLVAFVLAPLTGQQENTSPTALDFAAAAEFSAENAGLAVLVYDHGELVFERYQNGHRRDRAQHIFSGTKSFAPIVALIAQDEGLLDLDERVCDTITEWRGDARKEQITVRHLLNFTSGLKNNDSELHSMRTRDKYAAAVACDCVATPGKRFRYGSNHLMVFGELFRRKLDARRAAGEDQPKDFVAYLNERVLTPIGCRFHSWLRDAKGNPALPYGAYMTAREWARFGLLLLNRGRHGDRQIVPEKHFDECFVGSKANPYYGLNFWLIGKRLRNDRIPADTVSAAGMFNQRLYIIPSRQLLVVRLGKTGARTRYSDAAFLGRLFAE